MLGDVVHVKPASRLSTKQGHIYNKSEHLFPNERELLRWDSNPGHTAHYRGSSMAGSIQEKGDHSNLT